MYFLELEFYLLNFYEDLSNRIFNIDLLYLVLYLMIKVNMCIIN